MKLLLISNDSVEHRKTRIVQRGRNSINSKVNIQSRRTTGKTLMQNSESYIYVCPKNVKYNYIDNHYVDQVVFFYVLFKHCTYIALGTELFKSNV